MANSLLTGKLTGNSAESSGLVRSRKLTCPQFQGLTTKFPTAFTIDVSKLGLTGGVFQNRI
jgi:hypothetical protein